MTNAKQFIPASRLSAEQRRTLDTIGTALKKQLIGFHAAAELSDMVKAGQVDEVVKHLKFNVTKQSIPASRFSAEERRTLDAIGTALKKRLIDFHTAVELSDMIKIGRADDVLKWLEFDPTDQPN